MSAELAIELPPAELISSTTSDDGLSEVPDPSTSHPRSLTKIAAPSDARSFAIPLPIPLPAPVTIATLSFNRSAIYSSIISF